MSPHGVGFLAGGTEREGRAGLASSRGRECSHTVFGDFCVTLLPSWELSAVCCAVLKCCLSRAVKRKKNHPIHKRYTKRVPHTSLWRTVGCCSLPLWGGLTVAWHPPCLPHPVFSPAGRPSSIGSLRKERVLTLTWHLTLACVILIPPVTSLPSGHF